MEDNETVMTVDAGTSSVRAILWRSGKPVASHYEKIRTFSTMPGFVEQDPGEILAGTKRSIDMCLKESGVRPDNIDALSITTQRESVVAWDKNTGIPVYPSINWQDSRSGHIVDEIERSNPGLMKRKTGLIPSPYFSAPKITWLLKNIEKARKKAMDGDLIIGTIDTWLLWNMTHEFKTDYTNASRTLLFDIRKLDWDQDLLDLFSVKKEWLPEVLPSSGFYGNIDLEGRAVPVMSVIGDQQASMIGHGALKEGESKVTYGTGSFLLTNAGKNPKNPERIIETVAYSLEPGKAVYAFEGSVFSAGSAMEFLKSIGIIREYADIGRITKNSGNESGIYFIPAFSGLAAPYWSHSAAPLIIGFSSSMDRRDLVPALIRSIAFQVRDIIVEIEKNMGTVFKYVSADGGLSRDDYLMQFQSDISGITIERKKFHEITSYGSYILSSIALGNMKIDSIKNEMEKDTFVPAMDDRKRSDLLARWKRAVEISLRWNDSFSESNKNE